MYRLEFEERALLKFKHLNRHFSGTAESEIGYGVVFRFNIVWRTRGVVNSQQIQAEIPTLLTVPHIFVNGTVIACVVLSILYLVE